jgi:hypothetical protein
VQTAIPSELFNTITNGRIERGMPPFGSSSSNPISADDRWGLVSQIYSFGTSPNDIEAGRVLVLGLSQIPEFFTDGDYWRENSNQFAFDRLQSELTGFSDAELWSMVAYGRSTNSLVRQAVLLDSATIQGEVINVTTGELVGADGEGSLPAFLRAFTTDLDLTLLLTTTVGTDGTYTFNLTDVPDDWIYITAVEYAGIRYSSDVSQISGDNATLPLDVRVYEQTADPSVVGIEQLHLVIDVVGDEMEISELYTFSNNSTSVFVGEQGRSELGTVQIALPENAGTPLFQKGFGSLDSFVPSEDFTPLNGFWTDTAPLRPGRGALNVLVTYRIPYEDGLTVSHPLPYITNAPTIVMRDNGITIGGDQWTSTGSTSQAGQDFLLYEGAIQQAGDALLLAFTGDIRSAIDLERDPTAELIIGGVALLLALVGVGYMVNSWRNMEMPDYAGIRQNLLHAIADLDDQYEAKQIKRQQYQRDRQTLLEALQQIWDV